MKQDSEEQDKEEQEGEEQEKKEEKKKKEEKQEQKEKTKEEVREETREIPAEIEPTSREIIPILKTETKGKKLEESLAEVPTEKTKEERKYEGKPSYSSNLEGGEEREYIREGGERRERNEKTWEEVTQPPIEKVTDLLPKRDRLVHMQEERARIKVEDMEKPQTPVKYEQRKEREREPFEEALDWHKKEKRKIKKYEI